MLTELEQRADTEARHAHRELVEELERILASGPVEIAAHSNRLTEYMFHWEGQVEELEAKLSKSEALLAKAVGALERSAEGWSNVLYFNIIASQYRTSVGTLRDEARAVLTELKGEADD
jgi:hypothetical protein